MIYLSQMLGLPVVDSEGEQVGTVNDLGIATGEVFPRVTSLAFVGPGKTPFMISWRKYVEDFDGDVAKLKEACPYLFRAQGPTGSTGAKPQGASSAIDDAIERGFKI